jgi:hypothetical protein
MIANWIHAEAPPTEPACRVIRFTVWVCAFACAGLLFLFMPRHVQAEQTLGGGGFQASSY